MPSIEFIRSEIERIRTQIGRQRKEILQLQRAGIGTASGESLLVLMQAKVNGVLVPLRTAFAAARGFARYLG